MAATGGDAVTLAVVALVGTCLTIIATFVGVLRWILKVHIGIIEPALHALIKATEANTRATEAADAYLRERNGRDHEFWEEVRDSLEGMQLKMVDLADRNFQATQQLEATNKKGTPNGALHRRRRVTVAG